MRVLHCIYDDPGNPWVAGGGAVRAYEIYRRLSGRLDVTILTGAYPGARDQRLDGVRYVRAGARRPYAWSRLTYGGAASRALARSDYDVGVSDFSVYTPVRVPWDRPVGHVVHHLTGPSARVRWGAPVGWLVGKAERRMLRRARWISFASRWTLEQAAPLVSEGAHLRVVGAGVADRFFGLDRAEGEADEVLYFGRLDVFQKGLDTLLDAFALMLRERPSLRLRIAGRGKDREVVERRARALGVTGSLVLEGAVADDRRLDLLRRARLLLMPSRFEGFGMVAAEAMAAGVPLVATTAGSLPEVVAPPAGGVLVPAEDAGALAREALRVLDSPALRRRMSETARASAERFRWDAVADRHMEFLEMIAASSGAAAETG